MNWRVEIVGIVLFFTGVVVGMRIRDLIADYVWELAKKRGVIEVTEVMQGLMILMRKKK